MKYTLKEKLKYVKMHVEDNVPLWEIYNTYGFRLSDLKYLCKLYRMWGEEAFLKEEGTRSCYTREMKLKAIIMKNAIRYLVILLSRLAIQLLL